MASGLATSLAAAASLNRTSVIVPLYSYPENSTTWAPLRQAIAAHPQLHFQVVINPDSGPGSSSQPDAEYGAGIVALKKASKSGNVQILGYVPTGYGKKSNKTVIKQIAQYAGWNTSYAVDGIFFDETIDGKYSLYKQYYDAVKSTKAWPNRTVVLNPGLPVSATGSTSYYNIADTVVTFEDDYKSYQSESPLAYPRPSKQSVIIHSYPVSASASALSTLVKSLVKQGVGSTYITNVQISQSDVYQSFGSDWTTFMTDVAQAQPLK
ncbi:uncharacterized protein L969DRAFT_92700 [Mixia osmundae IAM 14324]|uniref:Spherulin 4-like cell surface protein n=1 Tax=Mixia osmundae (strain CBS 9802 / IAM 14324 / JCM 22182 / KY 12970) TaxID=764103 RepID=G7DYA8_MIXOS|nr:uncharacterized protein L969DRAFT_92700 [Mixia osmundae IAM 14324]KEI41470.1 hypothetical protein L969DRAFT_92700 [Mixia osmundae IAM 14324]GAA95568.1 hypothetical protein E5Q_02223 [Mixia osmundae IAM 14324]